MPSNKPQRADCAVPFCRNTKRKRSGKKQSGKPMGIKPSALKRHEKQFGKFK